MKTREEINHYSNCHTMLKYWHGSATKCENPECKSISPKRYEWALKHGREYSKNVDDYIQLCPSCHRKYDLTEEIRERLAKAKKGKPSRRKPIIQLLNGQEVAVYESITHAFNKTKISRTAIANCLSGLCKTCGGYIWKYAQNTSSDT